MYSPILKGTVLISLNINGNHILTACAEEIVFKLVIIKTVVRQLTGKITRICTYDMQHPIYGSTKKLFEIY